jgi:phage N-6-adenine-methyltransferase
MNVHFSSKTPEWFTPQELFDKLEAEFHFTLDPAATKENAKCLRFYTKEDDGLSKDWSGERVFCNPPYGREIGKWIEKAAMGGAEIVVALLPARTDTKYFHEYIYQKPNVEIRFLKGRLKFGGSKNSAPFPSMLVIFT